MTHSFETTGTQCTRFLHLGFHVIHMNLPFQQSSLVTFEFAQHHKEDHNHSASSPKQCPQVGIGSHREVEDGFGHRYLGRTWWLDFSYDSYRCFVFHDGWFDWHIVAKPKKCACLDEWMRISGLILQVVTVQTFCSNTVGLWCFCNACQSEQQGCDTNYSSNNKNNLAILTTSAHHYFNSTMTSNCMQLHARARLQMFHWCVREHSTSLTALWALGWTRLHCKKSSILLMMLDQMQ